MAIRVDTIYESLNRLAKTDACRMTNAFYLNELGIMENFYHELYKLISSHRVDVSLLPLSALSKLIESSSILQNSLISTFPTSFYEVSRLSLLSIQKKEWNESNTYLPKRREDGQVCPDSISFTTCVLNS